ALAAQRNGLSHVIAPARNEPDIEDIPEHLRRRLTFTFVQSIGEVLEQALEPGRESRAAPVDGRAGRSPRIRV
ncbi:MAG: lon, partial [Solirubrobacterales bacterium]|nr:lon [Solirubrobacterales bacterium]